MKKQMGFYAWMVASSVMAGTMGAVPAMGVTVDFSDVALPAGSYDNGGPLSGSSTFSSGGVTFNNTFTDYGGGFVSWSGWSLSAVEDATTAGYGNQYASAAGSGATGSGDAYAVGYAGDYAPAWINLPAGQSILSADVVNTTYGALSMRDGDGFAKKFGGAAGTDPDFLSVTFTGYSLLDAAGTPTSSVTVYLADYRAASSAEDYILTDWTTVDLSSLGGASSIGISFASSDVGSFGINTPTYVALDNLVLVPEPAMLGLLGIGGMILGRRRRA